MSGPSAGMEAEIERVAAVLRAGGVAAVPTDTVYGLACDAGDPAAVERVYRIKRRPAGLELGILAAGVADVAALVVWSDPAEELARRFWPGPLSLILPVAGERRLAVPRQGGSLSVRVPAHALLRALLERTGPLASTSANRHGEPPCADAASVSASLGPEVDAVLDGGPAGGRASTIIDLTVAPPRVLRAGPVGETELRPYLRG